MRKFDPADEHAKFDMEQTISLYFLQQKSTGMVGRNNE